MTFEHEITFNDNSIQYLTSNTNYLNDDDKQFLIEIGVDLTTIKSINTYKLQSRSNRVRAVAEVGQVTTKQTIYFYTN